MSHPTTEYRLRAMLIECRNQFQMYGDLHMGKVPPQHEKAGVNYGFVREINDTLLNAHTLPVEDEFDAAFDRYEQLGVDLGEQAPPLVLAEEDEADLRTADDAYQAKIDDGSATQEA
jgi:hypothetical protein